MRVAVLFALTLSLAAPFPASAQNRVADIYAEMAKNAARAEKERADAWAKMIAELAQLPVTIMEQRPVAPATAEAPSAGAAAPLSAVERQTPASDAQQRYLEEALAYMKEQDNELRAREV